ncbi:MAG TPA: hypothetical protein EYP29_04965 [Thermoplasmata archaeon]|nr:hypothetical protein [Thermoplasmata archaeon]
MNDVHYLALAYLCGLVLFLLYLYLLDRYQRGLKKEVEHLTTLLKRIEVNQNSKNRESVKEERDDV